MLDLSQLFFDFTAPPVWTPFQSVRELEVVEPPEMTETALQDGRDETLEAQAREWLHALEMPGGAKLLTVSWNARLRSTAGYARYPKWAVELNPLLRDFEGQVERTLKHELAHLIAYHRSGRRRIEPHGREWRQACVDLGIAGEKAQRGGEEAGLCLPGLPNDGATRAQIPSAHRLPALLQQTRERPV
jgi:SprT protein